MKTVRIHVDGSAMMAELESRGIDISGNVQRVPNGIEADAVVTDREALEIEAAGGDVLEPGEGFGGASARAARRPRPIRCCSRWRRPCASCAPTGSRPRARASCTSRRGRPRAQTDPVVTMRLENDAARARLRVPPDHEPVRRLGRVHVPPQSVQARRARARSASRSSTGGVAPAPSRTGSGRRRR